jgi:hypothetical protein
MYSGTASNPAYNTGTLKYYTVYKPSLRFNTLLQSGTWNCPNISSDWTVSAYDTTVFVVFMNAGASRYSSYFHNGVCSVVYEAVNTIVFRNKLIDGTDWIGNVDISNKNFAKGNTPGVINVLGFGIKGSVITYIHNGSTTYTGTISSPKHFMDVGGTMRTNISGDPNTKDDYYYYWDISRPTLTISDMQARFIAICTQYGATY